MKLSASKAALLKECPYAFRESTPWLEERGRAAINGDRFHKAIATYITTGKRPDTGRSLKWLEERLDHAEQWVDANKTTGWRVEVAYAYDPAAGTGRVLGYDIGREYEKHGKLPHEIGGSADIAGIIGDVVTVDDWKTGRAITDSVWEQMSWLGLFAARATGAWRARLRVLHATDYGVITYERTLSDVALWHVAERLRLDVGAIDDAWPTAGEHCDSNYCPARAGCQLYQLTRKGEPRDQVA